MEKLEFKVPIAASPEKVWEVLWEDKNYRDWTSAFCEGSHVKTDWEEGSKILFLDGNGRGMVSKISTKIPNEYMSFEHLGNMIDGVEDFESAEVTEWAGSHENYTLTSANGLTELMVQLDTPEKFKDFFNETWPVALDKIRTMAEKDKLEL